MHVNDAVTVSRPAIVKRCMILQDLVAVEAPPVDLEGRESPDEVVTRLRLECTLVELLAEVGAEAVARFDAQPGARFWRRTAVLEDLVLRGVEELHVGDREPEELQEDGGRDRHRELVVELDMPTVDERVDERVGEVSDVRLEVRHRLRRQQRIEQLAVRGV